MSKKSIKTIVGVLVAVMSLVSPIRQIWASPADIRSIDLQEIKDTAIINNSEIKLLEEKINLAKRKHQMALAASEVAKDKYILSDLQRVSIKKQEILYPMQTSAELEDLIYEKENRARTLELKLEDIYYKILDKQKQESLQLDKISRVQKEYDIKKAEVEVGKLTQMSLALYEVAVSEAKIRLETLQRDENKLVMELNKLIGEDISLKLILKEAKFDSLKDKGYKIDEVVKRKLEESQSLKKMERDLEIQKKERWIVYSYSFGGTQKEIDSMDDKILKMEYDIRDEKVAIELKVRSDYNNLLNLKDDITLRKLGVEKALKLEEIAKVKYTMGSINILEYMKNQTDVDDAKAAYEKAQLDYYIAALEFENYINQ